MDIFNYLFSGYMCTFNQALLLKLSTFRQIHHIFPTIHDLVMYYCKQFYCAKILCTDISDKKRKLYDYKENQNAQLSLYLYPSRSHRIGNTSRELSGIQK